MSGQLRALKTRIKSVENTQKITRAMEMVATANLKRYQTWMLQSVPYVTALEGILTRLLRTDIAFQHPLLETREEKEIALVLVTSDTGLCGSYNHDLIETAKKFLRERTRPPLLIGLGKNGVNGLTRIGGAWHATFKDAKTGQLESVFDEISQLIESLFCKKKVDAVYVVHSQLINKSLFRAGVEKVLPFSLDSSMRESAGSSLPAGEGKNSRDGISYIMEPDPATLFAKLIPLIFESKMRLSFLESLVAEQTARMNAMHQATENASELIDSLVLLRNKIRQAAITKELIEIVSGSKALKT